jgi:hypothetical protein
MTDDQAGDGTGPKLTNEERLRALTSDRKPKSGGKSASASGQPRPTAGDTVDAVRERNSRDTGKDQPI